MVFALLAALVAVNIAYLFLLDRKDQRQQETSRAHREELQTLLQRIQAPERAVIQHENRDVDMTPAPPIDPLTDESYAEQMQMMERLEREAREFEQRRA